jgi:hypothetical protein
MKVNLHQLLRAMVEKGASDMHITTGLAAAAPHRRRRRAAEAAPALAGRHQAALLLGLTEEQKIAVREEERARPLVRSEGTSRASARTCSCSAARSRALPVHPVQDPVLRGARASPRRRGDREQAARPRPGDGPTGSGKSTTLASIIDKINSESAFTSSRSKIRSSFAPAQALHRQPARGRRATRRPSRTRSSTCSARTPTSSSSARCATSRRSRPR